VAGVYFDTTVFTSVFKPEKTRAAQVRDLLRDLKKSNTRVHTSIISVQECSVTSFKRGQLLRDYHAKIESIADIHTVGKEIAINAAKLEAEIIQQIPAKEQDKPRRKWDCFHIATARQFKCHTMYSWDKGLIARKDQLGITDLEFAEPISTNPTLKFGARRSKRVAAATSSAAGQPNAGEKHSDSPQCSSLTTQ
jgi:predicted nucleic acid-binding protein